MLIDTLTSKSRDENEKFRVRMLLLSESSGTNETTFGVRFVPERTSSLRRMLSWNKYEVHPNCLFGVFKQNFIKGKRPSTRTFQESVRLDATKDGRHPWSVGPVSGPSDPCPSDRDVFRRRHVLVVSVTLSGEALCAGVDKFFLGFYRTKSQFCTLYGQLSCQKIR